MYIQIYTLFDNKYNHVTLTHVRKKPIRRTPASSLEFVVAVKVLHVLYMLLLLLVCTVPYRRGIFW